MRKITVAGAGHGGITAGIMLAKKGYDVTVYELHNREDMGYDWHDCMNIKMFERLDIPLPDEKELLPFLPVAYYNPARSVKLVPPFNGRAWLKYIDRKVLINHLISQAEAVGVKFVFGAEIKGVITRGTSVCGIKTVIDGAEKEIYSDLVIDAAGIGSPVRRSLPSELGIMKEIPPESTFYVYRAYYSVASEETLEQPYTMYFFNDNRKGMDWLIREKEFIDVLIGTFGPMDMQTAQRSVEKFRADYSFVGEKLLRGGDRIEKIPLRRTLPVIVANGYAAVGDSASMTEPLSGSGINLSMAAGNLLAQTVIKAGERKYTVSVLWDYQYEYFKRHGNSQLNSDFVKNMLSHLSVYDLDGLFEGKLFTEKEVASGASVKYTNRELAEKVKGLVTHPAVVPALLGFGISSMKKSSVCEAMPTEYDKAAVKKWAERYERL